MSRRAIREIAPDFRVRFAQASIRATPDFIDTGEVLADHPCNRLEHDPEKWEPVFGKRSCSNKELERDDDSKKNHPALAPVEKGESI
jgi:hypothetical protein